MIETENDVQNKDAIENSNKVESINSEKGIERSIVKNSVADQHNIVIDTEESQPMMNKACNVHYIYKDG